MMQNAAGLVSSALLRTPKGVAVLEQVVIGDVVAALDRSAPSVLSVRLSGKSASREAGKVLAPLFDRILAEAKTGSRGVSLHFEGLEYFNSSTISALVQFIRAVHEAGVGLTVVYDGAQKWQAMSFDALRRALRPFESGGGPAISFRTT
jgi:hypothetical protein